MYLLFPEPNIYEMKVRFDIQGLTKALFHKDLSIRNEAAEALEQLGWKPKRNSTGAMYWIVKEKWERCLKIGSPAIPALVSALKFGIGKANKAEKFLKEIGKPAVSELIFLLKTYHNNFNMYPKVAAIRILGEIGDISAVEPLLKELHSNSVRKEAAKALEKLGWKPGQDETGALFWIIKKEWDKCIAIGASAVQPLINNIKVGNKGIENALIRIGTPAVEPLISTLKREKDTLRYTAAEILGEIGDVRALEPLIVALKDNDWRVRKNSARALSKLGDNSAIKHLIPLLDDRSYFVRQAAAETLDKLGWKPGQNETGALFWIAMQEWDKCIAIGEPAVLPLINSINFQIINDKMSDKIEEALVQIDTPAVDYLIHSLKTGSVAVRRFVLKVLVNIAGISAIEPITQALNDSDESVRMEAVIALGKINKPNVIDPLIIALNDSDDSVMKAAAEALSRLVWIPENNETGALYWIAKQDWDKCVAIGAPAVKPLISALKKYKIRMNAAKALSRLGAPAVEPLIIALNDKDNYVRKYAIEALGNIGDPRAIEPITATLLNDESILVRSTATDALKLLNKNASKSN